MFACMLGKKHISVYFIYNGNSVISTFNVVYLYRKKNITSFVLTTDVVICFR